MTTIHISPQLADKLTRLAERQHKTVDEVLERLLEAESVEETPSTLDHPRPGSGAALLKAALDADIQSATTDTAERSREILNNEFANYLYNRIHDNDDLV